MQPTRRHTAVGRLVLKVGSLIAKKKARQNRVKLGAAGIVAAVVAGGVVASKAGSNS
jgi:hypothetical protein